MRNQASTCHQREEVGPLQSLSQPASLPASQPSAIAAAAFLPLLLSWISRPLEDGSARNGLALLLRLTGRLAGLVAGWLTRWLAGWLAGEPTFYVLTLAWLPL